MKDNCLKVLIIKNDGIGDLICASGIIAEIAHHIGEGVDLATCKANADVANELPGVARTYLFSRDDMQIRHQNGRTSFVTSAEDQEVLSDIGNTKYDIVIVLRRYIRQSTFVIMQHVTAKKKYCAWEIPSNLSIQQANQLTIGWTHWNEKEGVLSEITYSQLFAQYIFDKEFSHAPELLRRQATNANSPQVQPPEDTTLKIGLSIGGASSIWPRLYWIILAILLRGKNVRIDIFGAGRGATLAAGIISRIVPNSRNFLGKLGFMESRPYLEDLDLLVGNDTGFTHFASLYSRNILVLQGGGTFGRFFPWPGARNQHLISAQYDCYDCNWKCRYKQPWNKKKCLTRIFPHQVNSYIKVILSQDVVKDTIDVRSPSPSGQNPVPNSNQEPLF